MMRMVLFMVLFVTPFTGLSQTIPNVSKSSPTPKKKAPEPPEPLSAAVYASRLNVFYVGVDNPLTVMPVGVGTDRIAVAIDNGAITGNNGSYVVNVSKPGTTIVTISVHDEKNTVIGRYQFRNKIVSGLRAKFAGKSGGNVSVSTVQEQSKIFAILDDFEFEFQFTIRHFTMYIWRPRSDRIKLESADNALTPEMISALKGIVPGSTIIFDAIEGIGIDGINRQLDPIFFNVN